MQAFPFRGRCPSAHTGADEVRPSKPPVPPADHRNRAAQCAAPTAYPESPFFRRGRSQTVLPITDQLSPAQHSQARKWNRNSYNFCYRRPQWAGGNLDQPLRFPRAGNFTHPNRYASPRNGVRGPTPLVKGRWPKARGDREGEYEREALILSRPRRSFGYFPIAGKVPRRPQAAKISPYNITNPLLTFYLDNCKI